MPDNLIQWTCNNKVLILLGISTFCLLVSTVVLAQRKIAHENCIEDSSREPFADRRLSGDNHQEVPVNFYKLPRNVIPKNYNLTLAPDIKNKTFKGNVAIALHVTELINTIILHSNKLEIHSVQLLDAMEQRNISLKSTNLTDDSREFLIINLAEQIPAQHYLLKINFSGSLDKNLVGFYTSKLKNGGYIGLYWLTITNEPFI